MKLREEEEKVFDEIMVVYIFWFCLFKGIFWLFMVGLKNNEEVNFKKNTFVITAKPYSQFSEPIFIKKKISFINKNNFQVLLIFKTATFTVYCLIVFLLWFVQHG